MTNLDATIFEDAARLEQWLADCDFVPYIDFELITVTMSDGALEIDPKGNVKRLSPYLEKFAGQNGYTVEPLDPERGTVSLLRVVTEPSY